MKPDKYFQKSGYQNYRYREVRRKIRHFLDKEDKEIWYKKKKQNYPAKGSLS